MLGLSEPIDGGFKVWPVAVESIKQKDFIGRFRGREGVVNISMSIRLGGHDMNLEFFLWWQWACPPLWPSWWAVAHFCNELGLQF